MKRLLFMFFLVFALCGTTWSIDVANPFAGPPGGLSKDSVPVFIVLGADDNTMPEGMDWISNFIKNKRNPAGKGNAKTFDSALVRMSFYLIGSSYSDSACVSAWKRVYADGNEVGNHTFSHYTDGYKRSLADWTKTIAKSDSLTALAMQLDRSTFVGFRTPLLSYNAFTYQILAARNYLYDCSIEEGVEDDQDGTCFFWPYTLDNGSPSDAVQLEWVKEDPTYTYSTCGKTPGLWEIPVYNYEVPPDSVAAKYGFKPGVRGRILKGIDWFDTTNGKMTGFDYNLIHSFDDECCQLDSEEYLATLKYSLDQRFLGNRCPITINFHPDEYVSDDPSDSIPFITQAQRKGVVESFINYALTKPDVRFVTAQQLVQWLKNPVDLNGRIGVDAVQKGLPARRTNPALSAILVVKKSVVFNLDADQSLALSLFNCSGQRVWQLPMSTYAKGRHALPLQNMVKTKGAYILRITNPAGLDLARRITVGQ